jgi:pectate lyase
VLLAFVAGMTATSFAAADTVLLQENFEDGIAQGWTFDTCRWNIIQEASTVLRQQDSEVNCHVAAGSLSWTDYTVKARMRVFAWNGQDRSVALLARRQDANNHYALALRSTNNVELRKTVAGSTTRLAIAPQTVARGTWYNLRLEVLGSSIRGFVNNVEMLSATDSTFTSGAIGGMTEFAGTDYDDVLVTSGTPTSTTTTTKPTTTTTTMPVATNQPPVVNAGPDQTIVLPAKATLAGSKSDDGLPNPPATTTCTWSKVAGPTGGTLIFVPNRKVLAPTVDFHSAGGPGNYRLRLTCSDSVKSVFDSVVITVQPSAAP